MVLVGTQRATPDWVRMEAYRMDIAFSRFRSLSAWGYIFLFGALLGLSLGSSLPGETLMWAAFAAIGVALLGLKYRGIPNPRTRMRALLADLLVTLALLAFILLAPAFLGLLRAVVTLAVEAAYLVVYVNLLYQGRLVARAV